jgi:hypothetical protein
MALARACLTASVPVAARTTLVAVLAEVVAEELGDVALVLDDEHPSRRAIGGSLHGPECRAARLRDDDAPVKVA